MNLLLAEDDRVVRITVRDALEHAGFAVTECADGQAAVRAAEGRPFDVVLSDVRMPGLGGIELFHHLRRTQPSAAIVLMTAWANTEDAVTVMREGARDYITKPFEMDELLFRLGRVRRELEHRRGLELPGPAGARVQHVLRGTSDATRRLLERIEAAAGMDVGVVITGETGTGKDLCARTIHERSRRAAGPFVALNCAAIPEALLEAELFGHEKGAFTGADKRRPGRLEAAAGGTLLLDEVAELPLSQQAKLLRVIDTRRFEPLGGNRTVEVDVRVVAATNADLEAAVAAKRFRQDLYYRLNVIEVRTPPLRERRADIPELVADFLSEISVRHARPVPALAPPALAALCSHGYPGNVRELIHALEHAVALARDGVVRPEHLPRAFEGSAAPPSCGGDTLAAVMREFERHYILQVLNKVGGQKARAAELLGISRKALWQKLKDGPP